MSTKTTKQSASNTKSTAIFLTGNLGKPVATREFKSGKQVARTSLAVNQGKDQPPQWFNVEAWGGTAAYLASMCEKGQRVALKGFLKTESYTNEKGQPATKDVFNVIWVDLCVNTRTA
jgi:single-strand DNA-binding protein